MFSVSHRQKWIQEFKENQEYDVVIIGGGITGAGVARDAASRGMKVALVEANDFAFGTSSRSSKLIHGGIRYLENMEFGLVFEALSERRLLFEIAPHLVHPLRFVLPLYESSRVGMFKMGLGMWLYDLLAMFEMPKMHERLDPTEALYRLPMLKSQGLRGAYAYSDAYMDDDRLVIETLRSAVSHGARCVNYVKAGEVEMQNGKIVAVKCRDIKGGTEFKLKAKHFVSTVGPWTDFVAREWFKDWRQVLRPSKGIHLTLDRKRLPMKEAIVMAAEGSKRIVFGIPRNEMVIIGTTDTDYPGDPGQVHSTADDVRYLLQIANDYFPGAKLTVDDIICSYSGVRPLVHDGAANESATSREHLVLSDERNITFITGGKYTTYRRMAEDAMRAVLQHFSIEERVQFGRNQTKVSLNPLATPEAMEETMLKAEEIAADFAVPLRDVQVLVGRHGAEALKVLAGRNQILMTAQVKSQLAAGKLQGSADSLGASDWTWLLESAFAIDETMCTHLVDFYIRRSPLMLAHKDHGLDLLDAIGGIFAHKLNWSQDELLRQKNAVQEHLKFEMGWRQQLQSS